jgi:large subunit ribosomal protein L24
MHIKKGDTVTILTGDDKGKSGKVVKAIPTLGKVIVEGLNTVKKHQKPTKQGQKGQTVEVAMPMHASNVVKKA